MFEKINTFVVILKIMEIITLLLLAIGLSFDTFAVSVSSGLALRKINFVKALRIAFSLALFQGGMLLIGGIAGSSIKDFISDFDHWVAFTLLFILGVRMIIEGLKLKEQKKNFNPLNFIVLISMSIATSIDALAVGISYALSNTNSIYIASLIIAFVTGVVSMLGILFGKNTGKLFGQKMEILGGIILIIIGIKILVEHTLM